VTYDYSANSREVACLCRNSGHPMQVPRKRANSFNSIKKPTAAARPAGPELAFAVLPSPS